MQFNSVDFMCFFPIVLVVYFFIPSKLRESWLLVASYYFYMSWNPKYALLIAFSTLITYGCGLLIDKADSRYRGPLLIVSLITNLGILGVFKYGNFILDSLSTVLQKLGIHFIDSRFNLLLPVGISFYTFQALGYVIDVYRGTIKAEKNLVRYALFVSFFPQLVAGPIERSKNLLNQMGSIPKLKLWDAKRVTSGAILMVWGYFLKMVIADRVSILVDLVFNNYRMYGSTELILAAIGFSIQIYCDFSSYSLIAIGAAKVMGFELMENFAAPYFAKNVKEFWSRWHISLSTWFRDYLYIPLGGNRRGKVRKYINLMIVFLVSGLWHGASWNFVVWGGIHGIYQIVGDATLSLREKIIRKLHIKTKCFSWQLLRSMGTYTLITGAWIFFRADTLIDALRYLYRIVIKPTPWLLFNGGIYSLGLGRQEMNILFISLILMLLVDWVRYKKNMVLDVFLDEQNIWFKWLVMITLIVMIFVFGEYGPTFDAQQFIYFQF